MTAVTNITEQLQRDEGLRLFPYVDTTGSTTIGYGRNLTANGISIGEARVLFDDDLSRAELSLASALPWTSALDAARRGVLINMCFNMGVRRLLSFVDALRSVESGDYALAAKQMLQSEWLLEVGGRATRLAKQMETGEWQ